MLIKHFVQIAGAHKFRDFIITEKKNYKSHAGVASRRGNGLIIA